MGTQSPFPKRGGAPIFGPLLLWPNCCMDLDAAWYGGRHRPTRHCVTWGPSSPSPKGAQPPIFDHCRGQTAGWTKTPLCMEVGFGPGDCVRWGPSYPQKKGHMHPPPPNLSHVYCGLTAGWMKTPLGMEVDLGTGHILLDVVPAVRERATAAPSYSPCLLWPRSPISATAELLLNFAVWRDAACRANSSAT